ncbi:DNA-binding transcriptional LysR family regulator [Azospirillum lipoferum]|uniref:LysR family transcriptional regulator n=1 Tax=Azospirillum lipoferum TaxID=193 RepID=A0A5A9GTV4_AZOLI|nr:MULTISPECIES: LysR family transcriptional regulator [Azospirillum]KAA0597786.1 LysR family transcriptional regulator [Azospirillum lipoferum]MCP1610073.1 DNA-binding transcriptional LysR family regulator [Azospirillum lipoferum]MDW5534434.1 LysR substrate-binding domain-containing protein [Azospirillum sp. NL1]
MDLAGLRVVKAVADTGSVSRAAEALNCVQSNVTARIKRLEEDLGVDLFLRLSRGMEPTPAGRVLSGYADRVLRLVAQARDAVAEAAGRGGRLAVGSMESTAAVRLPPVLARFHRAHPDVELTITPGPTETLLADVLAGRLDGAFVGGEVVHPDLIARRIFDEELVLAEPAAGLTTESARRTLIAFGRACAYRGRAEMAMREAGRVPFRVMEFGALDAILGCVGAGMGVTVMPRSVVERDPWRELLVARPLPDALARMPTQFVRRADAIETASQRAFLKAFSEDSCSGIPLKAAAAGATGTPTSRTGLNGSSAAC